MQPIEFDITDTLDKFSKLTKSMPFLISKSLNDVAFERGRKAVSKEIHKTMKVRSKPFASERAIRIKKATQQSLEVSLFHVNEVMGLQQFGGTELPKGKKLAIPIRKNLAKYAGVPVTKKIPKGISVPTLMDKAPRSRAETIYKTRGVKPFIMSKGIAIRTDAGLRLLYVFASKAQHRKKLLKMQEVIERTYNINFERYFERNYLKVLKG